MFQDKYVFAQLTAFLNRKISVAIITYCLVAIVHHDMQLKRSTYEVLKILSISLTDNSIAVTIDTFECISIFRKKINNRD